MSKKFDIFISYRRKGGYDTAKLIYDRLRIDGYSVSFDIDTLEKGDFDDELKQRVNSCKDFLIILNPGVFDRLFEADYNPEDDWVYQEIKCAISENKNIVPLVLEGFAFTKNLPSDINGISKKNAIDLNPKHFEGAYAKMKQKFLISKPHWAIRHKKIIFSFASVLLLSIAACIYFLTTTIFKEKEQELQKAKMEIMLAEEKKRQADSIMHYADSIRNAKTIAVETPRQAQAAVSKTAKPAPQKSSEKTLHWGGLRDTIGQVIFEKISSTGIKKTKCSENGLIINVSKPKCQLTSTSKYICSYNSIKAVFTTCDGQMLSSAEINVNFKTAPQANEEAAKEELAKELRNMNFGDLVSAIKNIK
ncbi:MAG: toll/interleukin-1 receptor domain-containing protein [Fibromonadaceae bacterium]|jgi:hypothetical protein|nr:toll/interleukin-1 receptor domain-containing protein [Fibromonadaceae bacterium]